MGLATVRRNFELLQTAPSGLLELYATGKVGLDTAGYVGFYKTGV